MQYFFFFLNLGSECSSNSKKKYANIRPRDLLGANSFVYLQLQIWAKKYTNYLKSCAEIVAKQTCSMPKRNGEDCTIPATLAAAAPACPAPRMQVPAQVAAHVLMKARSASNPTFVSPSAIALDLANIMAASIKAALKPMKERLEATIIRTQRTLESLQAEFVALRSKEKDEAMIQVRQRPQNGCGWERMCKVRSSLFEHL